MQRLQTWCRSASFYIFIGLLAYMPLHILLSTWLGTSFHLLEVAKVAKDVVLVAGFLCAYVASIGAPWLTPLLKRKILWLIGLYAFLTVLLAVLLPTDTDAEVLGVVYNVRFLLMFVYALLVGNLFDLAMLRRYAVRTVVTVGVLVAFFGVLQYVLLPDAVLQHLGYSRANGVLPAFFIDNKPDLERVMSTLRDPNSLGSYLIIIGSLLAGLALKTKNRDARTMLGGAGLLVLLCLLFTFSRSAWLGALVAAGTFGVLYGLHNAAVKQHLRAHKKIIVVSASVIVLLIVGVGLMAKQTYFVQNVLFHADQSTVLEDPNELRVRFWSESWQAVLDKPLGHGAGTAGLASIRNDVQGTVLTENYYLQVLYEVGFVGLLLFVAILAAVATLLYNTFRREEGNTIALALLASFAGLLVTNFLVHIWANEAVAYTFWALAGLYALAVPLHKNRPQSH